jgi:hypothetical protein
MDCDWNATDEHTGEVTSWTRCLSIEAIRTRPTEEAHPQPTDIQQNGAILLLVDNMGIQDLIVQGLGLLISGGHGGGEGVRVRGRERQAWRYQDNRQRTRRENDEQRGV